MDAKQKIEEALAAGPTEGPWHVDQDKRPGMGWNRSIATADGNSWVCILTHAPAGPSNCDKATADFIAACNPSAIREVLQTLASKEAEIARLKSGQAASLTDDQINDLWIRRDCIEAIQAGDISAQVRCVVRAALKQPTE